MIGGRQPAGGVVAAALDESMAWAAARAMGRMCVTGDLHVRYLSRVPGDAEIVAAVEEGRTIFANIRRFLMYLVAANVAEILVVLIGGLGRAAPLLPVYWERHWEEPMADVCARLAVRPLVAA